MLAVSVAKSSQLAMSSSSSVSASSQAQEYAESKMKYLALNGYNALAAQDRTTISGTSFQDNVVLGDVVDEGNNLSSRLVTVRVFKVGEALSRAALTRKFYSNDSNAYVVNENSPSNKLSMRFDGSNYYAKSDSNNERKLLTHMTQYFSGNLNNLVETGFFNGAGLGNAPDGSWYYIENIRHSNMGNYYIDQKVTNFETAKIYHRQCRNSTWSAWEEVGGGSSGIKAGGLTWIGNTTGFTMPATGFVYGGFSMGDFWDTTIYVNGNAVHYFRHQDHTHGGDNARDIFTIFANKGDWISTNRTIKDVRVQAIVAG